jgi:hypothetical protein
MKPASTDTRLMWLALSGGVLFAYLIVFQISRGSPLFRNAEAAGLNTVSLVLTALAARAILRRWILPLTNWKAALAHLALAAAFSMTWAWLLYVVTGIADAGSAARFAVVPFLEGSAQQWQMMQGLFAYAAVSALTLVEHRPAGSLLILDNGSPGFRERLLIKSDADVLTLPVADIVSINGADDYAEIVTEGRVHLVSTTLSELEAALGAERFLRVHRSAIVNVDRIHSAESIGGGRMRLTMTAGPDVAASRAGTRLLRERLI